MNDIVLKLAHTVGEATKRATSAISSSKRSKGSARQNNKKGGADTVSPADQASWAMGALGTASYIVYLVLAILICFIFPFILTALRKGCVATRDGLNSTVEASGTNRNDSAATKTIKRICITIPTILLSAMDRVIIPVLINIFWLAGYCLLIVLFTSVFDRNYNDAIDFASICVDVGVAVVNMLGYMLQFAIEVKNYMSPIENAITRLNMFVMLALYDGVQNMSEWFGDIRGRGLGSVMGAEGFMDVLGTLSAVILHIYNIQIVVLTTLIEFLTPVILVIMELISKYVVALLMKIVCGIQGSYCTILELFDYIVYDIIAELIPLIPKSYDIGCKEDVFVALGVGSTCYGSFMSIEPAGMFRHAPSSSRRSTLACIQTSGIWTEQMNGKVSHETLNSSMACPMTRTSTTPLGHVLNMRALKTHNCYDICVGDVLYTQCMDEIRTLVGPCGNRKMNWTQQGAIRRLNSIFTAPTAKSPIWMGMDHGTRRRLGTTGFTFNPPARSTMGIGGAGASRASNILSLRETIGGLIYYTAFGECDLSRPSTDIFEIFYDGMCMSNRLWSKNAAAGHRRLDEQAEPNEYAPWIDDMRHQSRIWLAHEHRVEHDNQHPDSGDISPISRLVQTLGDNKCPHGQRRCWAQRTCVPFGRPCVKTPRRRLDEICPGQLVCPDSTDCVWSLDQCTRKGSGTILGWLIYEMDNIGYGFREFDIASFLYEAVECWKHLRDYPEHDPGSGINIGASMEDMEARGVRWCMPLWRPRDWEWDKIVYSLRDTVYAECAGMSNDFTGCACPMFYRLPMESLPWGVISMDLGYLLLNGLIWIKNPIAWALADWPGWIWSSIFPPYMWPADVSNALSLYKTSWTIYVVCYTTHITSLMVLLLVGWFAYIMSRFILDIFLFCRTSVNDIQEGGSDMTPAYEDMKIPEAEAIGDGVYKDGS